MEEEELTERYLSAVKYYACLYGIWPFDKSWKKFMAPRLLYVWCFISLMSMVARVAIYPTFSVLTDQIPIICVVTIVLTKHVNCVLKQAMFGNIVRRMIRDWQEERTEEETAIVASYAERGVFYGLLYKVNLYFSIIVFCMIPLIPRTLDIILPLNESRPLVYSYGGYYYVNPDDYYYIIVVYNMVGVSLAGTVLLSSDLFMIQFVQHACGLLTLAGYRFKHAMETIERPQKVEKRTPRDSKFWKLCLAFQEHNKAIQYLIEIESVYATNLILQVFIMITAFSLTLYEVGMKDTSLDTYKLYGFLITQSVHMLFLTIQGQFVLDSHNVVYDMIYEAVWYREPAKLQVMYVMALRRGLTPPILTVGGIMRLDLNSYTELIKACVSYYTVLKSS